MRSHSRVVRLVFAAGLALVRMAHAWRVPLAHSKVALVPQVTLPSCRLRAFPSMATYASDTLGGAGSDDGEVTRSSHLPGVVVRPVSGRDEFDAASVVRTAAFVAPAMLDDQAGYKFRKRRRSVLDMMESRWRNGARFLVAVAPAQKADRALKVLENDGTFQGEASTWARTLDSLQALKKSAEQTLLWDGETPRSPTEQLQHFGVLPNGDQLLGFVDLSFEELEIPYHSLPSTDMYLCALAVVPAARRRGIGRALLEHAEIEARRLNASAIWLHAEKAAKGPLSLYRDEGYIALPPADEYLRFTALLNLNKYTTVLMRKDLTGACEG